MKKTLIKKALIIVDMINDFVKEDGVLYCGQTCKNIIPNIKAKIVENRNNNSLIIYLQDSHHKNDVEFDRFPPHAITDTFGSKIIPELAPKRGDIIVNKRCHNGFYETDLDSILKENDISIVEIVGVCTSICIMDTVGDLTNRNIKTIVPVSCVTDFDLEMHKVALKRMKTVYGCAIVPI